MSEDNMNDAEPMVNEETTEGADTIVYHHFEPSEDRVRRDRRSRLKMPTLAQLLADRFEERRHLLFPWLREHESCMVYADAGVGKSMFALSAALAIAGDGEFLGWKPDERTSGDGWRVLYIDGEMHISDIQERARLLLDAVPGVDQKKAGANLRFLARQQQDFSAQFPLITEPAGMKFVLERVQHGPLDLVILDNFSTLGEVEDENAAASFNAIQQFLLQLKVQGVATMLVHHAGKSGDFRGSSKLAATFETIIKLERLTEETEHGSAQFRVDWQKVRAGGPKRKVRGVAAVLTGDAFAEARGELEEGPTRAVWVYEELDLARLDDIKERLQAGELITQKEIGDLYGVTGTMARKYIDKGIRVGLWSEQLISRWFAKGKTLRKAGKTQPPGRASLDWKQELLEDETDPAGEIRF
jgi:hypothetical protein